MPVPIKGMAPICVCWHPLTIKQGSTMTFHLQGEQDILLNNHFISFHVYWTSKQSREKS